MYNLWANNIGLADYHIINQQEMSKIRAATDSESDTKVSLI